MKICYLECQKAIKLIILILIVPIMLISCTASVQYTTSTSNLRLKNYNNIFVNLVSSSGGVSLNTANLGEISSTQLTTGQQQGRQALESLQFELMNIGFNLVSKKSQADAIVDFSIGTIRFDPIAGWIADQAFVKFKDRETDKILVIFRANAQFITPTVSNIISNLSKSIEKNY